MADETQTVELSSLSFPGDPSKYPTTKQVPLGTLEFEIKDWTAYKTKPKTDEASLAKGNKGNKLALKVQLMVTAPEQFKGFLHSEDFYIGSNEDPDATKESTWAANASQMMKLLKESGVALQKGMKPVEALAASKGNRVGGEVKAEKDKSGQYPDKNRVKAWFKAGTRNYTTGDGSGSFVPPTPAPAPAGLSNSD